LSPADPPRDIRVLLFDVGGVLVQLGGIDVMRSWLGNGLGAEDLWRRWLESETVRRFETGKIGALEFSTELTREFGLSIEPADFLAAFDAWPLGLYPGTTDMLARIPPTYRRALLSNTNALHWPRMHGQMALGALFDTHFVSHQTGFIKPDPEAFEHVLETLHCRPAEVLFLDDNRLNVEAATRVGLRAVRVQGPAEAHRALSSFGIIDDGNT
jgi:putative hydrolase of the HAD superfamily